LNFKVTGILFDLPDNTDFGFEVLIPQNRFAFDFSWEHPSATNTLTFVTLTPGMDVQAANATIRDIVSQHTNGEVDTQTYLQPIAQWHLYNRFEQGVSVGGRIELLRLFTAIALLILTIACINFMNLSTAQSTKYAKEVGIRKVVGARRHAVVFRFLNESTLVAAIAGGCSLILVSLCLPFFNAIVDEHLNLNLESAPFWIVWLLFVLLTGVLAGSYPSFYLSSFLPVQVLKGIFKAGNGWATPRKALIIMQFTFAVVLISSTLLIHRQIQYVKTRPVGYDRERLVSFMINDRSRPYRELIRYELLETGVAESVSINFASMVESESKFTDNFRWRGKDPANQVVIERNYAQVDWAKTTGVEIIQGRDIDIQAYPTDSTAMLLNETAVKVMGFDDPIGEIIYEWDTPYHVVGVVKDFVLESPFDPIRPMVIGGPAHGWLNNINVRLSAQGSLSEKLKMMEEVYRKYAFGDPFLYHVVDDVYAHYFDRERRMASLVSWFAGLAVFISAIGLFGLSAYMAANRRREVGIRKVMGSSIYRIVSLLTNEFIILVTISLLMGLPVAWWVMNRWLTGYAYRTSIPWWLLAGVAVLTLGISLATVSVQALKAATANPVKAIMSE